MVRFRTSLIGTHIVWTERTSYQREKVKIIIVMTPFKSYDKIYYYLLIDLEIKYPLQKKSGTRGFCISCA